MRGLRIVLSAFALVALAASGAGAVEVNLTVTEPAGVARQAEPVTTGVPFAKGAVKDVANLQVTDAAGKPLPVQFTLLAPWPDGSVRWALMDTQVNVPANGKVGLVVTAGKPAAPQQPVTVTEGKDAVTFRTGVTEAQVGTSPFGVVSSVLLHDTEGLPYQIIGPKSRGLVLYTADGKEVVAGPPTEVTVEQSGPMRAVVCLRGKFPGVHKDMLQYTVRLTAYAGKKVIKAHVWLENQGGYGFAEPAEWFNFDGLALDLALPPVLPRTVTCEGKTISGNVPVVLSQQNPTGLYKDFAWTLTADGKEAAKGARTDGVMTVSFGSTRSLTAAVRHFWQNYEKAIEVSKAGEGQGLRFWFWPRDGEWPRGAASRSGEFRQFCKEGLYALAGARHKGYELILDFSGGDPKTASATLNAPLMALATPEYYATTEAVNGWFGPPGTKGLTDEYNEAVKRWDAMHRHSIEEKSNGSLYGARRSNRFGRWYGWHDFGDLFWQPGCSSLHYDWTWVMLLDYLRLGDRGFLDIGTEMARHRIDIDQIWSDRVYHAFRGLTFYEKGYWDIHGGVNGGYYKPIPSHNWLSGVVLYYFLTGEAKARECALRNADVGIKLRQVDAFATRKAGGQMRSTGWAILCLTSAYDMTADKKYLDWAMQLFNNNIKPKWEQFGPHLDKRFGLSYYYSTQGLVELAERTGNADVYRLIKEGAEKPPANKTYGEWAIFLSNLHAYVALRENDTERLKKAEELFSQVVPKRAKPVVFTGNGAWTKETVKTMRNGHILQYAEWKMKKE